MATKAPKDFMLRVRVATSERHRWEAIAARQGLKLSEWLRRCAQEEADRYDAEEGDAAGERAQRLLLREAVYPQVAKIKAHPQGKKTYSPDPR